MKNMERLISTVFSGKFNQCFQDNSIQRVQSGSRKSLENWTEHNLYSTRFDKVCRMNSTQSVQLNTAWRMETQHRLYKMKTSFLTLYTFTLYTFREFSGNENLSEVWTIRACTAVSESCTVSFNHRPINRSIYRSVVLTAEIVRQTNAWSTARVLECSLTLGFNNLFLLQL